MTERIVQVYGKGFSENPVSVTATFMGNQVFSGTVPTIPARLPNDPDPQVLLFSFGVDVKLYGTLPMSITFTGDTLLVGNISANYNVVPNPIYTESEGQILNQLNNATPPPPPHTQQVAIFSSKATPPFSAEELGFLESAELPDQGGLFRDILLAHACEYKQSSGPTGFSSISKPQAKKNVLINGQPVSPPDPQPPEYPGEWGYYADSVDGTGTISFGIFVAQGQD